METTNVKETVEESAKKEITIELTRYQLQIIIDILNDRKTAFCTSLALNIQNQTKGTY